MKEKSKAVIIVNNLIEELKISHLKWTRFDGELYVMKCSINRDLTIRGGSSVEAILSDLRNIHSLV